MPAKLNLLDNRFGRLLVLRESVEHGKWLCLCDCGAECNVSTKNLRKGHTKSCGCLHKEGLVSRLKRHGMAKSKIWTVWHSMVERCTKPYSTSFARYGGRGIQVCDRWLVFENFYQDMGEVPDGCSIDRIDVNGNYSPDNCRWADADTQRNNKRNSVIAEINGVALTLAQWSRKLGVPKPTLYNRVNVLGMSPSDAVRASI